MAPLIAASRDGRLDALLACGVAVVERSDHLGRGTIGDYAVTSDSTAATFITAAEGHRDPRLGNVARGAAARALRDAGRAAVPLDLVASFLGEVGATLAGAVADAGGVVLTGHETTSARLGRDGLWRVVAVPRQGGDTVELDCERLVLATGGNQPRARLADEPFAGEPLLPAHADRLLLSDAVLRHGGAGLVLSRLAGLASPRVVVAGSNTSALSVVRVLLTALGERLGPGAVTVLHRRPPRVFYPSAAAALAEDCDFGPSDVCPVSGFVFRCAGSREEARELAMAMLGLGGRAPEGRARFVPAETGSGGPARAALREADIVVAATGYRPNLLHLVGPDGRSIDLAGAFGGPAVDGTCRVLDRAGGPVAGVFGIGLAAGCRPSGKLGGEPSFQGQANGLWLWQNDVGALIVDHLLNSSDTSAMARPRAPAASVLA